MKILFAKTHLCQMDEFYIIHKETVEHFTSVYSGCHLMGQCQSSGHLSKTYINILKMCEISFVDTAMSRAYN